MRVYFEYRKKMRYGVLLLEVRGRIMSYFILVNLIYMEWEEFLKI